jgi:hypothetical protein
VRRTLVVTLTAGLVILLCVSTARPAVHPLRVSPDRRHLVDAGGAPFLYLADTAWQLFHRLTREEAQRYLEDRAGKGFTVIQAVVLGLDGLDVPNAYGEHALVGNDPRRPNEAYFAHVDWIVDRAAALGLTVGMLPTWGDVWHSRQNEPGPRVFDAANALGYGRFVGRRDRDRPVILILGGDRNPETEADRKVVRAMAAGLRETAPERLITYHPRGPGRSSDVFHREDWLDFDDYDVRVAAYRALLAGAAGHTYGDNNVWQMWARGRKPQLGANTPWHEALDHAGAFQMGHLRRLFESRPWQRLEPAQDLVLGANAPGDGFVRAALAHDRSFAFVYSPRGETVAVDQARLGAMDVTSWWFDPRYGRAYKVHTGVGTAVQFFTPPSSGRGCDWVLVLDDASRGFQPPGER